MRTHKQFMSDMQPIFDMMAGGPMTEDERREARERIERAAGPSFRVAFQNVFHTCKAADNLPPGCDGCKETLDGRLVCCINQEDEE